MSVTIYVILKMYYAATAPVVRAAAAKLQPTMSATPTTPIVHATAAKLQPMMPTAQMVRATAARVSVMVHAPAVEPKPITHAAAGFRLTVPRSLRPTTPAAPGAVAKLRPTVPIWLRKMFWY